MCYALTSVHCSVFWKTAQFDYRVFAIRLRAESGLLFCRWFSSTKSSILENIPLNHLHGLSDPRKTIFYYAEFYAIHVTILAVGIRLFSVWAKAKKRYTLVISISWGGAHGKNSYIWLFWAYKLLYNESPLSELCIIMAIRLLSG